MKIGNNKVQKTIRIRKELLKRIKEYAKTHNTTHIDIIEKGVELFFKEKGIK